MTDKVVNISHWGFSILQIETESTCNMQCKFCPYPERPDKGERLPERNILNVIDSLTTDAGFKYIAFNCYNEPLLDERIYGFVRYAKKRNLAVRITTNGLLFRSQDVINKLIDSAPDSIKISLQTANPKLFQSSRGVNINFKEYEDGILEFLRAVLGKAPVVTVDLACNFLSGLRDLKTKLFGLERGDPSVYNTVAELRNDIYLFLGNLKSLDRCFIFEGNKIDAYLKCVNNKNYSSLDGVKIGENIILKIKPFTYSRRFKDFYPVKSGIGCRQEILAVLATGNVVPCCVAYGDMISLGNIKEEPLKIILEHNTDRLINIRDGLDLPLCCQHCLGAPTKLGVFFRKLKHRIKCVN